MTRHYCIICFLAFGIVSNVFCQTKDPKIVRDEELTEIYDLLKAIRLSQCLFTIGKAEEEIKKYDGKTQYSLEDVNRRFDGFMGDVIAEPPMDVSVFPSTPGGHVIACDGEIAERVVSFSNEVAKEANEYETEQGLRRLNLG